MPRYKHDCEECKYLGEDRPRTDKEKGKHIDCYYHPGWRQGLGYFTRRWGSAPNEHWTVSLDAAEGEVWYYARISAKQKGLLK